MEINSNLTVKCEMKDYDTDSEVKNIRSGNIEGDEKSFLIVKKEIVKNEEQEGELSEDTSSSSYHYLYPNSKIKEELNDKDLCIHKQIKTENQHKEICFESFNVDKNIGEFPKKCDVEEKIDVSEVALLPSEHNSHSKSAHGSKNESKKRRISKIPKVCLVPICPNTSKNTDKIFVSIPKEIKRRQNWWKAANVKLPFHKRFAEYICEDHFDLEQDADNWMYYKTMGSRIILKKHVVPHKYIHSRPIAQKNTLTESEKKRKMENIQTIRKRKPSVVDQMSEPVPNVIETGNMLHLISLGSLLLFPTIIEKHPY